MVNRFKKVQVSKVVLVIVLFGLIMVIREGYICELEVYYFGSEWSCERGNSIGLRSGIIVLIIQQLSSIWSAMKEVTSKTE